MKMAAPGASARALSRLLQRRHEERAASGIEQRRDYTRGAQAVGVSLDHGSAFGRRHMACERAPVCAHLREVDGDDAGGPCGHVRNARRRLCGVGVRRRADVNVVHGTSPREAE